MNHPAGRFLLIGSFCLLPLACATPSRPALDDTVPSPSDTHHLPPLHLTQAWDNHPVDLPAPARWPDAPRASPDYQRWLVIGNITQFRYTDPADGHTYVADAANLYRDSAGTVHAFVQQVTDYRPDGTRARQTQFLSAGYPAVWTTYAPDGQSPLVEVHTNRLPSLPIDGPVYVDYFYTHSPDTGQRRRYDCTPDATITTEWPVDAKNEIAGNALHSTHRVSKAE